MSEIKVNVDELSDQLGKLLNEYGTLATQAVDLAVEDEAKEVRNAIRRNITSSGIKGRQYRNGWQIKKENRTRGVHCTIYNSHAPGLVHLLEKGHRVVVSGKQVGNADAYAHVAPATEDMATDLADKVRTYMDLLG